MTRIKGRYRKTVVCKTCGIEFTTADKRAVACSRTCGRSGAKKPRTVRACENCGKEIARTAFKGKWAACSTECQLVVQAKKNGEKRDTTIAKRKWYYKQSLRRRMNNEWWRHCVKNASKLTAKCKDDPWSRRCASAASLLNRNCTIVERKRKENIQWEQAIAKAMTERHTKPQSKWGKKCSSIVANLKRRKQKRPQLS